MPNDINHSFKTPRHIYKIIKMIVEVKPSIYNITVVHRRRGQYTTTSQFVGVIALCCLGRPGLCRKNKMFLCLDRNKKDNYCLLVLWNRLYVGINQLCFVFYIRIFLCRYHNNSLDAVPSKTQTYLKKELKLQLFEYRHVLYLKERINTCHFKVFFFTQTQNLGQRNKGTFS